MDMFESRLRECLRLLCLFNVLKGRQSSGFGLLIWDQIVGLRFALPAWLWLFLRWSICFASLTGILPSSDIFPFAFWYIVIARDSTACEADYATL
jgi:hypothetical protein